MNLWEVTLVRNQGSERHFFLARFATAIATTGKIAAPGRRIAIDVLSADELELSVSARFVEALDGTESGLPVEDYLAEESAEEAVEGSAESAAAQADAVSAPASGDACGAPPPAT